MAPNDTTSKESGIRARRFEQLLRRELSSLIAFDVKDPKASHGVVTRVEVSSDLRTARVHVRLLDVTHDEARRRDLLAGLRRARGMLRREVTDRLKLRYAPDLRFVYDDGVDHGSRVEELLEEIAAERRSR